MRYKLTIVGLTCFLLGTAAGFEFGARKAAGTVASLFQQQMVATALGRVQLSSQALLEADPGKERRRLLRDVRNSLIEIGGNAARNRPACNEHQRTALQLAKRLDLDRSDLNDMDAELLARGLSYCSG